MAKRKRKNLKPRNPVDLTTYLANYLIEIPKVLIHPDAVIRFGPGMDEHVHLKGQQPHDQSEQFKIVIDRSTVRTRHAKFQLLAKKTVSLLRLEIGSGPHQNPDFAKIECPHLHVYREDSEDEWAQYVGHKFGDPANLLACFKSFLTYCNVVQFPEIIPDERRLF